MPKTKRKKAAPRPQPRRKGFLERHSSWIPLAVIFILLLIFFNEVIFGGKTFLPPDALAARSYRPFVQDALKRGIYPLWNPYIFSGMPSFASLSSAPFVDILGTIINGLLWLIRRIFPLPAFFRILLNYFLFGIFTYLLVKRKTGVGLAALFSALTLIFMPAVVGYSAFGHNTKLLTACFIPLVFYLVDELLETRRLLFFAAIALAIGLQLLRAHIQIAYYSFLMVALYTLYWVILKLSREKQITPVLKSVGLLLGALLLGFAISSWLYLSVYEYSHYSIRGGAKGGLSYEYATSWSFSPKEMLTFLIPSFMGFGGQTYWGKMPFTDFPLYMGIVPLILAGLAFIFRRDRYTWFLLILGIFALLVSFGKEFPVLYNPMFKLLPYFNKFRVPAMIQILLEFSVAILAGLGLAELWKAREYSSAQQRALRRYLLTFGGICGLLFLVVLFSKGSYLNWVASSGKVVNPLLQRRSYNMALGDAFKMILLFGATAALVWYYWRGKLQRTLFGLGVLALLVIDLWSVDFKLAKPRPKADEWAFFKEDEVVRFLKKRLSTEGPFRILPVYDPKPPNWYMYHLIPSAYGYHPAKLRIYQEMLEYFGLPERFFQKFLKQVTQEGRRVVVLRSPEEIPQRERAAHNAILDMLNVRYLVCPYPIPDPDYQLVLDGTKKIYENTTALPRAFFVKRVLLMKAKDEIFRFFQSGNFNPGEVAILEEDPPFAIEPTEENRVRITHYDIHEIRLEAEVVKPALLVLSEIYYPGGWRALVDGQQRRIYKTNYLLRSVFLEPGHHTVIFRFQPQTFRLGLGITVFTFVGMLGAGIRAFFRERKRRILQKGKSKT